ncbi:Fic family protein [Mycoplasma yeatsii]|uniref:Fic family protein n=1 Tax=Mycoplasma yeatsii TaxID=51365 RepID=A0ABU0ND60_9MOLU|nr:Fic family protein [Mycoplasma yeatsii]MDQ0567388.1 Fic family protein [Mycoplasma yeatsii]
MKQFDYSVYIKQKWDNEIIGLLTRIYYYKGLVNNFINSENKTINKLIKKSFTNSVESSNKIEGISTSKSRLKNIIDNIEIDLNTNEQEILGYKNLLEIILNDQFAITLTKNNILNIHKEMLKLTNFFHLSKFKTTQNHIQKITKIDENTYTKEIIFTPLEPFQTPEAIEQICDEFNKYNNSIDPLLLIPIFIHDFLCIHPFNDGNGRVSRLLTTLLLLQNDIDIARYISIDEMIYKNLKEYYDSLALSSQNWIDNNEDKLFFIKYFLKIILLSYEQLNNLSNINNESSAMKIVINAVKTKLGSFTKQNIVDLCVSISVSSVEQCLSTLVKENKIATKNSGKNTIYYALDI